MCYDENVDDTKLTSFIKVYQLGSFTKAADDLFLTPVAVKNQIDVLEEELGERLFIRKPTGCTLTPVGEIFLNDASSILELINKAKENVEKAGITARGEILAGHDIAFNYKYVGALSTGFSEVVSDHFIQFEKIAHEDMASALLKRQVNCLFAESTLFEENRSSEVDFRPLITLPYYAIMKKGHPLSKRKEIDLNDMKDQELYITGILRKEVKTQLGSLASSTKLIEETDRNTLFNRIMKNAVEIYPNSFDYYSCVPLKIEPLSLGIFTLKNQPSIMKKMIDFTEDFTKTYIAQYSIM